MSACSITGNARNSYLTAWLGGPVGPYFPYRIEKRVPDLSRFSKGGYDELEH